MKQELAEQPVQQQSSGKESLPDAVPVPRAMLPHLKEMALLLDIDGTLLDLAPTPREVWVPPGLSDTLNGLLQRTFGALAMVSGRSLNDIDLIFAPDQFPAVGGHGAEMRLAINDEAVASAAPPMDKELKRRLAAIAKLSPGILLEDKGYSLALHYRLAPHAEKAIYEAVSLISGRSAERADRGAAGKISVRDQACRLQQGLRRVGVDEARAVQGSPASLYRRRRHRRVGVCDHAGLEWLCVFRRPARTGRDRSFRSAE